MRKIGIVGAGQAGLQLGFGLLENGYEVTIISNRTPEQINSGRITGLAVMFDRALSYERELGLNFWDDTIANWTDGVIFDLCPEAGNPILTMEGSFGKDRPAHAIDQRMKFDRWLVEFEKRGGNIEIINAEVSDLEKLADKFDLLCVGAGKGAISGMFTRNPKRSVYPGPQRKLATFSVSGCKPWPSARFENPTKFQFVPGVGELFYVPFTHRSGEQTMGVVFMIQPGKDWDRFETLRDSKQAWETGKKIIHEYFPWEKQTVAHAELTDEMDFMPTAVPPTVRDPVGRLPSGKIVLGIGDTVILQDPMCAQGANNASKMVKHITESIIAHGDRPFDEKWMTDQFETDWEKRAQYAVRFTNSLLDPITPAAREVLLASSRYNSVADAFMDGFDNPDLLYPWILETASVRAKISALTGRPWPVAAAGARAHVAVKDLGHRLGLRSAPSLPPITKAA